MTTAAYRSHDVDEYYGSNTVTLPAPAGLASGDVLLASFVNNDGARVLNSLPSGWTQIASAVETAAPSTGFWLCKKVAGGSEPATYDFVFNYDFNGRACIVAYQDGSDVSVYGTATAPSAGSTSPYDIDAAAITVPDNDSKVVFFGALRSTTTGSAAAFTPPTSYTERVDSGSAFDVRALTVADITQASAGSSGAVEASVAQSGAGAARTVGVLVAIAPSGGSSTISASGEGQAPVITSITVAPTVVSVPVGNYVDAVATVRDQKGIGLAGLTAVPAVVSGAVASASALAATTGDGSATIRLTGLAIGTTTVTVSCDEAVSLPITVTVVPVAAKALNITPTQVTLENGQTQQFTAQVSEEPGAVINWSVPSGTGSISSTGLYTASVAGSAAVVRASWSEDANTYAEAQITVLEDSSAPIPFYSVWKRAGIPLAGTVLNYWIIAKDKTLVTQGTAVLDSNGGLLVNLPAAYQGEAVLVVVNNIDSSMTVTGKIHSQQVVRQL